MTDKPQLSSAVPMAVQAMIRYLEKLLPEDRKRVLATIAALYGT